MTSQIQFLQNIKGIIFLPLVYFNLSVHIAAAYIILSCIDMITGAMKGYRIGQFDSNTGKAGVIKKLAMFLMVVSISILLQLVAEYVELTFDYKVFTSIIMALLCVSEVGSIIGNVYSIQTKKISKQNEQKGITIIIELMGSFIDYIGATLIKILKAMIPTNEK